MQYTIGFSIKYDTQERQQMGKTEIFSNSFPTLLDFDKETNNKIKESM